MIDIFKSQVSYMTDKVAIIFKQEPTLQAIEEARKLLNDITDTLIEDKIK